MIYLSMTTGTNTNDTFYWTDKLISFCIHKFICNDTWNIKFKRSFKFVLSNFLLNSNKAYTLQFYFNDYNNYVSWYITCTNFFFLIKYEYRLFKVRRCALYKRLNFCSGSNWFRIWILPSWGSLSRWVRHVHFHVLPYT